MSFVLTPAAFRPSITSSISSLLVLAPGLPTGFILMPTTSPGSKKRPPGLDRVVGAGQLLHAAVDGRLDRLAALLAVADHRLVAGLDHPAGIRAGDARATCRPSEARRAALRLGGRGVQAPIRREPRRRRPGTGDGPCRRRDKACSWSIPSCKSREWPGECGRSAEQRDGMVGQRAPAADGRATRPMITPGVGASQSDRPRGSGDPRPRAAGSYDLGRPRYRTRVLGQSGSQWVNGDPASRWQPALSLHSRFTSPRLPRGRVRLAPLLLNLPRPAWSRPGAVAPRERALVRARAAG